MNANYNRLVELFESIEHLLKPLSTYTQMPSTPVMDELVVRIMAELLSTLALKTKELKQGRQSEHILADQLPELNTAQRTLRRNFLGKRMPGRSYAG